MRCVALCGLLLIGCGGTVIGAGDYDQSCLTDVDCAPVFQGDACASCACSNTAVNAAVLARYEMDLAHTRTRCGPRPAVACAPCAPKRGLCTSNRCSARPE